MSVVGLVGRLAVAGHKRWMMEVYVEIVILAGSGIWDLGLQEQQQQQHVFAGKPVGKAANPAGQ